ncbi:chemotaxis protein CheB [Corallococcus exiguus]|uniref:chemotaxis protein CheB n=2 Tax=Corallococcus TaxID=83461 RepID=UPI0027B89564|nr:chemotaxis protein CheB [Corallococcus exiguus]
MRGGRRSRCPWTPPSTSPAPPSTCCSSPPRPSMAHAWAASSLRTGANADGALGLQAVKRRGGVTLVQAPNTARSPAMPQAAVAAGPVDFVLPLEQMPAVFRAWGDGGAI